MPSRRQYLASTVGAAGTAVAGCLGAIAGGRGRVDTEPATAPLGAQYDGGRRGWVDASPPTSDPDVIWRRFFPPGMQAPVAQSDIVYVPQRDRFTAFRVANGGVAYGTQPDWSPRQTPAIVDDTVYVPAETSPRSESETCVALDASDGTEQWRADVGGHVTPAADGVVAGGSGSEEFTRIRADGTEAWTVDLGAFASPPAVVDGDVWIGTEGGTVHRFDAEGSETWTADVDGDAVAAPTLAPDGTAFVVTQAASAYRLAPDGSVVWKTDLGDGANDSATLADGILYAPLGDGVVALDTADGNEQWRAETAGGAHLTAAGDALFGVDDAAIVALDRETGEVLWSIQTYPRRYSDGMFTRVGTAPVAIGDTLLVAADTGELFAIRA